MQFSPNKQRGYAFLYPLFDQQFKALK